MFANHNQICLLVNKMNYLSLLLPLKVKIVNQHECQLH